MVLALQQTADEGGNNATFWRNDELDATIDEALATTTLEESLPIWQEAMAIVCNNAPLAPVFFSQNTFAWNDGIEGVNIDAFGVIDYEAITTS
ncbi:hypothetical protein [Euzebya tangerina]|uniref:hypothetical protein n=1 Tax=Euzebya tangerina TaxID=591198 RepID=UPI000E30F067|nr:hypothetical protein [Euzebya tangerina]